jgi:hypothetical protein
LYRRLAQYCAGDKIEENEIGRHVARMGEERRVYRVLVGELRERDHWGDPGIGGRIILGWIFRKWDVEVWTGLDWFRIETGGGHL